MNKRRLVIGDIHGAYRALVQCLERANFNYDEDELISLGDIADGWTETVECFEELFKIKHLTYVRGNHDQWLKQWLCKGDMPNMWTMQGGQNTIKSYQKHPEKRESHKEFLKKAGSVYVSEDNKVFVHGGIDPSRDIQNQDKQYMQWDRSFWENRNKWQHKPIKGFDEIYVGHTSIYHQGYTEPYNAGNIWFMDTGAGWEGVLSIMDIDSKEVFQSDKVSELYPEVQGRD